MIAAALSIQDPRERPAEKRAQADQLHARFADEQLGLRRASSTSGATCASSSASCRATSSASAARPSTCTTCASASGRTSARQLRQAAREVGVTLNRASPPSREPIHIALLSGLLSHVGLQRRRAGASTRAPAARASRLQPGSVLAAQAADVGDGRRARRDLAAVGPHRRADPAEWIEPLAEHLVRRTYDEPRWDAQARLGRRDRARDAVRAADRRRAHGRLRARSTRSCRASCSSAARSSRATGTRGTRSWRRTRGVLEEVEELEHRARRRDILVGDEALFAFYDARIPADVVSGAHFDRWWRDARRARPGPAALPARAARRRRRGRPRSTRARGPTAWRQGDLTLPLTLPLRARAASTTASPSTSRCTALAAAARRRLRLARAGAARTSSSSR